MFNFYILALIVSVSGSVYEKSHCPLVKPVRNFNFNAFGQGVWYEVARYPNHAESGGDCGSAVYELDGDVIKVKHIHVENNKQVSIEGIAHLENAASGLGKLYFILPYGDNGEPTKSMLEVLATDYNNYAIAYYCKYDDKQKTRQDFAWILSRTKVLPYHVKAVVNKFIRESEVLEASKFMWPDFSDGACRIEN